MKRVRTALAVAALTTGLLMVSDPVAMAAPVAAVQDQTPTPQPAPDPSPIGSVSQVAQGLTGEQQLAPVAPKPTVGRYASPAAKSSAIWDARGRPEKLVIVRRNGIDTVANGVLQRHWIRPVGSITLGTLAAYLPASYLSVIGGTARLSATLVLSTGVTLNAGAPITNLVLVGGATAPAAASVFTGGGALTLRGVQVTSADPSTGAPMPDGPGRPYIQVSEGGKLDVSDATITDLGSTVGPTTHPGVEFNGGSGGSVVRTALTGNTVGLRLDGSDGVSLENVTVSRSGSDGLVLSGDTATLLSGVVADGNGNDGVVVSGRSSARPITGITAHDNHGFGVSVVGQAAPKISAIAVANDGAGGLEINRSTDVSVIDSSATDEPVGVYTHVGSSHIALIQLTVTGGRTGVQVEKTTSDLTLAASHVEGTQLGLSLGGHQMALTDVTVVDSETAAVVERGATDANVARLTISGGRNGFVANPGTTGVVLEDLTSDGTSDTAVRALSPGAQIVGGRINGSTTGIDIEAPTTLNGVTIGGVETGVRARTPSTVQASQVDIEASSVGINIADGTPFQLSGSTVDGLESIRGEVQEQGRNALSLPQLSVLGAIGVPLIGIAVLLELFALGRQRRWLRRRSAGIAASPVSPVRSDPVTTG